MKSWAGFFLPGLAVVLAVQASTHTNSIVWQIVWLSIAWFVLAAFFVQKYPKTEPLKWIMGSLSKGEIVKVELESK